MKPSRKVVTNKILEIVRDCSKKGINKLPAERELARVLGISRNSLREALVALEVTGVLVIREKQGIFIKNTPLEMLDVNLSNMTVWPEEFIQHVMEVRFIIEVPSAMLAAKNRTDEEIEKIRTCIETLSAIKFPDNEGEAGLWDAYFHSTIVESSHNPLLSRMYENFSAFMKNFIAFRRKRLYAVNVNPEMILTEHKMILDDIISQDGKRAAMHMRDHLSKNLKNYRTGKGSMDYFSDGEIFPV